MMAPLTCWCLTMGSRGLAASTHLCALDLGVAHLQLMFILHGVQNDALQEELRMRRSQAMKYILTAARLIAPVIGNNFVEGYDWIIALLKDQQYVYLAHEMEMDKATQHLKKRNYSEVCANVLLVSCHAVSVHIVRTLYEQVVTVDIFSSGCKASERV